MIDEKMLKTKSLFKSKEMKQNIPKMNIVDD